jgi:uncharacterized protein (DUF1330 family)
MIRLALTAALLLSLTLASQSEELEPRAASSASGSLETAVKADDSAPHRIFELRTYYLNDGKLDDLHKRFREHTCTLLKKHGADLVGFWTPTDTKDGKGSTLIYLVAFPSRDAAKKTWSDFNNDPEWQQVYAESHKNGVLVKKVDSVFMEPTDYSTMK